MFALLLPPRSPLTTPLTLSPTQLAFTFPPSPVPTHLIPFLIPGSILPPSTLAAVYIQYPGSASFEFLGALGDGIESAVFDYKGGGGGGGGGTARSEQEEEDDMLDDASAANGPSQVTVGISIESAASVQAQLASLPSPTQLLAATPKPQLSAKLLAQRIAKNAFNFLASFAKEINGEEMVSLKAFREWWERFERRLERDEGFLGGMGDV